MSINIAILLGNVGNEPKISSGQNGDKIASFSIATSESWKDKTTGEKKEKTEWHTIVVFNQHLIPVIEQSIKKGSKVSVEGKIRTRKWQDKEGHDRWSTEIVIGRFEGRLTLEGSPSGHKRDEGDYGTTQTKATPSEKQDYVQDLDDEVPF